MEPRHKTPKTERHTHTTTTIYRHTNNHNHTQTRSLVPLVDSENIITSDGDDGRGGHDRVGIATDVRDRRVR